MDMLNRLKEKNTVPFYCKEGGFKADNKGNSL